MSSASIFTSGGREEMTASSPESTRPMLLQDSRFSCNICLESVSEPVVTQCGHLYCWPCLYRWLEPGMLPQERQSLTGSLGYTNAVDETRRVCPVCKAPTSVPTLVPIYVRTEPISPTREVKEEEEEEKVEPEAEHINTTDSQAGGTHRDEDLDIDDIPATPPQDDHQSYSDPTAATGLRQRLRFRSRDSEIPEDTDNDTHLDVVPARPAAISPSRNNSASESTALAQNNDNTSVNITPLNPTNRASLSHGLALSFQQALRPPGDAAAQHVPPLHRREGHGSTMHSIQESDPDATEFLSRILLMLGSFVILCLLLF